MRFDQRFLIKIIDTNAGNILEYGVCGYKNINNYYSYHCSQV